MISSVTQRKEMTFKGEVEYFWDETKDTEWVTVDGRNLVDMLRRMGYQSDTVKTYKNRRKAKIRINITILEPGVEFSEDSAE